MKITNRFTALILSVILVLGISMTGASAVEASPELDITTYATWKQLSQTSNSFDISSTGVATMIADTQGRSNSTKVTVEMYLERLQNGTWTTVSGMSWSTSSTSDFYICLDKTRTVMSGYNYRLRSEHSAKGPNGTEYDTVYSGIIYY